MKTGVRTLVLVVGATMVATTTGSLHAQDGPVRFLLPLDVGQGAVFGRGEPTPYTLSARLTPMISFGPEARYRFGATGALTYANPDWEIAGGGRLEVQVLAVGVQEIGVFIGAEALRGTGDRTPITLTALVDLAIVRAGLWLGRDVSQDHTVLEASAGADLVLLYYLLFPSAAE